MRALLAASGDAQPPSSPSRLATKASSQSSITLGWAASRDNVKVTGYGAYLNGARIAATSPKPTAFMFGRLACGRTYALGVDAVDAAGNRSTTSSLLSATAPCVDTAAPSIPSDVRQTTTGQTGVAIEWKHSSDDVGVAGYRVYRDGVPVAVTQQLSHWLGGLVCGAGYSASVEAFDAAGNRSSPAQMIVKTAACPVDAPPSAPLSLAVIDVSPSTVSVSWRPGSDDYGIVDYRASVDGVPAGTTSGVTTTTFDGLSCGRSYLFEIVAVDAAGGVSPPGSLIAATAPCQSTAPPDDTQPPTAPGALVKRSSDTTSIELSWSASTDNVRVAGYGLYRGGVKIADSSSTSYRFAGLSCGTTYTLAVDAVDPSGNRSARSQLAAGTAPCLDGQPPTSPTGLGQLARTETSITLSWQLASDDVGVAGYRVYRDGTLIGSTAAPPYAVTGLACGKSYTLAVEAYDAAGNHSARAATLLTTSACSDAVAPSTPGSLRQEGATATSVAVAWNASSDNTGVAGYTLYVSGNVAGTTGQTSYSFSALTCGTSYTIAVEAYDAAGNRSPRTSLSASTSSCTTPPPATTESVYVATDGSDANPCTQALPCRTFGRAYKAAAAGATVHVAAGTYPGQEIDDDPAKPSDGAPVIFQPSGGAVTVNGTLDFGQDQFDRRGPKGVTIRNMKITYLHAWPGSDRLTWENIDAVHFDLDATNSTIRGGDFGPCQAPRDDASCLSRVLGNSRNVLIENAAFHDITSTDLVKYHVDGMAIFGGENVTIRGNSFFGNMITNIRVQTCCGNLPIKNLVIENNWFALPLQGDGVSTNANGIDIDSTVPGLKIRFNSFAEGSYPQILAAQTDAQLTANLLTHVSCVAGVTYAYNVFKPWSDVQGQSGCSPTDKKTSSLGYASGFTIGAGSVAVDYVPTAVGCPAQDLVGTPRPVGPACDAGASERR